MMFPKRILLSCVSLFLLEMPGSTLSFRRFSSVAKEPLLTGEPGRIVLDQVEAPSAKTDWRRRPTLEVKIARPTTGAKGYYFLQVFHDPKITSTILKQELWKL